MTQQQGQSLLGFVVLVVDDDADSLNAAMLVIAESFGCGVLSASSCDDALGMLDSGAHVDLVFSDVVMPNKDGVTLAKLVRERFPDVPVVLATGYPDAVDSVIGSGAIPLIKPYTIPQLHAVLTEQLGIERAPPLG